MSSVIPSERPTGSACLCRWPTRGRCRPGRLASLVTVLVLAAAWPTWAKYAGGSGTSDAPYLIATVRDLLALAGDPNDWSAHYRLVADIDMAAVGPDVVCILGDEYTAFSGSFDGAGRRILHYRCLRPGHDKVGLFGYVRGTTAEVRDLRLVDPNVDGGTDDCVGALVGELSYGTVAGCHVENATVRGAAAVGGLIGWNGDKVVGCTAHGEVQGSYSVGGLAGINNLGDEIRACSAHARVTGINRVGGLIGGCVLASAHWSSAGGQVDGTSYVGGLVGCSDGGDIGDCYSTMRTTGVCYIGGLVGCNGPSCRCSSGYRPGVIRYCYSAGQVDGQVDAGGLVGLTEPDCIVEQSFWDLRASGMSSSSGGTALTTSRLQSRQTFVDAGWAFDPIVRSGDYWVIRREPQYPRLAWQIIDGDFDDDGDVDLGDLSELAGHWSQPATAFRAGGLDVTGDGQLDARDLGVLCQQWLQGTGSSQDR